MRTFFLRRFILLLFVLIGVSLLTFSISHVIPSDPARQAAGPHATTEQVELLREKLGLNKPLPEQYWMYISGLAKGDFGYSLYSRRPVSEDIKDYFPATVELALFAMLICLVFGIPLGVLSAVHKDKLIDHISRVVCVSGVGLPLFWLALLFQLLFYRWLNILPSGGRIDPSIAKPATITGLYILYSVFWGKGRAATGRHWPAARNI